MGRYKTQSLGRHKKQCSICKHDRREEIDAEYVSWGSPVRTAERFKVSIDAIYRHVRACGLQEKRGRNIRAALSRIIEHGDGVEVTASAVVSAIQAYAKINSMGQWVDRVEGVSLNSLFEKMTVPELEEYAKNGTLPGWFQSVVGANSSDREEKSDD